MFKIQEDNLKRWAENNYFNIFDYSQQENFQKNSINKKNVVFLNFFNANFDKYLQALHEFFKPTKISVCLKNSNEIRTSFYWYFLAIAVSSLKFHQEKFKTMGQKMPKNMKKITFTQHRQPRGFHSLRFLIVFTTGNLFFLFMHLKWYLLKDKFPHHKIRKRKLEMSFKFHFDELFWAFFLLVNSHETPFCSQNRISAVASQKLNCLCEHKTTN